MNDLLIYWIVCAFGLFGFGMGVLYGYLICLRNHKLIKGEETMWDKKSGGKA